MSLLGKVELLDKFGAVIAACDMISLEGTTAKLRLLNQTTAGSIKSGAEVAFNITHADKGIVSYSGKIKSFKDIVITLSDVAVRGQIQRRNDVKVTYEYKGIIYLAGTLEPIEVEFKDLSAGGVGFLTETDLDEEKVYEFTMTETPVPIIVNFSILRKMEKDDGYFYGCKFEEVQSNEEQMIRNYVFARQLEVRKHAQ